MPRKIAALGLIVSISVLVSVTSASKSLESASRWSGKHADASLRKLVPQNGFIADAKTWTNLWTAWRPGEDVPNVNFEKELVLVGTVSGPNLVILKPTLGADGDLRFAVGGTKIGGPGFGYLLHRTSRDGVKSVNGKPLKGKAASNRIDVEIVGRLNANVIAIGGETTGTTVTANGITWELDLKNAQMPRIAGQLDGKRVIVKGRLERRAGVEIQQRWIVTVSVLKWADDSGAPIR